MNQENVLLVPCNGVPGERSKSSVPCISSNRTSREPSGRKLYPQLKVGARITLIDAISPSTTLEQAAGFSFLLTSNVNRVRAASLPRLSIVNGSPQQFTRRDLSDIVIGGEIG
jgi:hypothetical protein